MRDGEAEARGLDAAEAVVAAHVGHAYPGAVLALGARGRLVRLRAFGRLSYEPGAAPVQEDSIYDLASLTKVVVTTTVAMTLFDQGALDLDAPVVRFHPAFDGGARPSVRVRDLLAHASGLPAWAPLSEQSGAAARRIAELPLEYEPRTRSLYSDLGFILLGAVLEAVGGAPFEAMARERVLAPCGMEDTTFRPEPALEERIAPTEIDPWRGRLLRGEVHDENAFSLGGVAPHAGLFGTAADLARFATMLLDGGAVGSSRIVSHHAIEVFTTRAGVPASTRALGWDTAHDGSTPRSSVPGTPGYSSAGRLLSARAFGHTGFTGTSLWIDPELRAFVILLTNRVNPTPEIARRGGRGRENDRIRAVRAELADAVAVALASGRSSGTERPAPPS